MTSPAQTRKTIEGERDLLAAVLEAADMLIVILDDQGRILRVNHAFEVATGYRGGDLRGRDFLDALPIPEARERSPTASGACERAARRSLSRTTGEGAAASASWSAGR